MAPTGGRSDGGSTRHLAHREDDDRSVGERIVAAVADREGVDPDALPSLDRSVNPDALAVLFETPSDDGPAPGCVTFSYYGYAVVVRSTGQVLLRRE
ncbi:MAG: HalOD1 output domain-containing protein [Haloferacaceae archaeon]